MTEAVRLANQITDLETYDPPYPELVQTAAALLWEQLLWMRERLQTARLMQEVRVWREREGRREGALAMESMHVLLYAMFGSTPKGVALHILILSYSHTFIFSYPHILIFSYIHILILSYSHTFIFSYSHILIFSCTHAQWDHPTLTVEEVTGSDKPLDLIGQFLLDIEKRVQRRYLKPPLRDK